MKDVIPKGGVKRGDFRSFNEPWRFSRAEGGGGGGRDEEGGSDEGATGVLTPSRCHTVSDTPPSLSHPLLCPRRPFTPPSLLLVLR